MSLKGAPNTALCSLSLFADYIGTVMKEKAKRDVKFLRAEGLQNYAMSLHYSHKNIDFQTGHQLMNTGEKNK